MYNTIETHNNAVLMLVGVFKRVSVEARRMTPEPKLSIPKRITP